MLVVRGFGRGFWLVARWRCKGMHESEFGRRGVMDSAEKRGVMLLGRNEVS